MGQEGESVVGLSAGEILPGTGRGTVLSVAKDGGGVCSVGKGR